jgi:hypothetical protein
MTELAIATEEGEVSTLPDTDERKAKQLPDPSGYRILCGIPNIEEQYESGIIKSDMTLQHEELLTTVLFVVKMGPDCYKDAARFPSGLGVRKGILFSCAPTQVRD